MRIRVLVTAALVAAVFVFIFLIVPSRPAATSGTVDDDVCRRTVAGAFHVHSTRSDGRGDLDAIAAAAARAGLQFVIVTDHGRGNAAVQAPQYRRGVLIIDGVEISTNQGHVVALDMPASPYPLGGEARDVAEDIARLGGFSIAAHPDSPKPELKWSAESTPVDGIEWINFDSEWRDESRMTLVRTAVAYPFGKGRALASVLDRPRQSLERWDAETGRRPVVGVAGHDAHGGIAEGGSRRGVRASLGVPSYDASFRAFALRAIVRSELTRDAASDAAAIVEAIRHGRVFTAVDAVAAPAFIDVRATAGGVAALMGETIPHERDARVTVRAMMPPGGRIVLLRGGREVAESTTDELNAVAETPGAYRIEVRAAHPAGEQRAPWLVSNPIYLRGQAQDHGPEPPTFPTAVSLNLEPTIEKDAGSTASASRVDGGFTLDYRLKSGDRTSQYVAAAMTPPGGMQALGIAFDVRASAPMRLSVQMRFENRGGARWVRSVYADPQVRRIVVPFSEFTAADGPGSPPAFGTASSILFVVDLVNAEPGQTGTFQVAHVAYVR